MNSNIFRDKDLIKGKADTYDEAHTKYSLSGEWAFITYEDGSYEWYKDIPLDFLESYIVLERKIVPINERSRFAPQTK